MSKARDIRLHEELLGKLDIIFCQLQTLSGAVRLLNTDRIKQQAQPSQEHAYFWEMQCRQKDAALNETLKELQAKDEALNEAQLRLKDVLLNLETIGAIRTFTVVCHCRKNPCECL